MLLGTQYVVHAIGIDGDRTECFLCKCTEQ